MKALARALINAAAYLELSDEESLASESTVQALEEIAYNLGYCTPEEKQAIEEVLTEMRHAERERAKPRFELVEFLETFLTTFGLEEGEDDSPGLNLL